jgi:hypothetical protein
MATTDPDIGRNFTPLVAAAPVEHESSFGQDEFSLPAAPSTLPVEKPALVARPAASRPPVALPDSRSGSMARKQADDTGAVHVTIGRIEITAVHAPPAKPKPAPVRQPRSLDEYLAQRNRGRS